MSTTFDENGAAEVLYNEFDFAEEYADMVKATRMMPIPITPEFAGRMHNALLEVERLEKGHQEAACGKI